MMLYVWLVGSPSCGIKHFTTVALLPQIEFNHSTVIY